MIFFAKTRADTIPLMLSLFFMDDYGDNETLLFFMMMNLGKTNARAANRYYST